MTWRKTELGYATAAIIRVLRRNAHQGGNACRTQYLRIADRLESGEWSLLEKKTGRTAIYQADELDLSAR
jgi:hypothetical protein